MIHSFHGLLLVSIISFHHIFGNQIHCAAIESVLVGDPCRCQSV